MSITIAMPRMSADPELTTAQSKYVESLARAGASVRWVELADPDKAVAEALECAGLLLPGGGDIEPSLFGQERIPACGVPLSPSCSMHSLRRASPSSASAEASRC